MPNTTAQTVGLVGFVSQIFGFLLEVPSGYISDRIGHKNALIISKFAYLLGTIILIFANNNIFFFLSSIFMSIGFAISSGTSSVFFQETLESLGISERYSEIAGKLRSLGFAVPIIFILSLPVIAENYGFATAFIFSAVIDLIGLFVTISMKQPIIHKDTKEYELENSNSILKNYFQIGWLPLVLLATSIAALSLSATTGFKNPFQESLGFSISMLGVFWAFSRLGISVMLLFSSWFKENLTLFKVLFLQGVLLISIYFGISYFENKWIIASLFISIPVVMWGFSSVKSHFFLDYIKDYKNKASYISLNNFIEKIIQAIFSLLMGYLVFNYSYKSAYLVFGLLILGVIVSHVFYSMLQKKKQLK
ncbi:MAG: MFS family permease [Crocinitomicaceae bacterium]|jgi:MFS family permease